MFQFLQVHSWDSNSNQLHVCNYTAECCYTDNAYYICDESWHSILLFWNVEPKDLEFSYTFWQICSYASAHTTVGIFQHYTEMLLHIAIPVLQER